MTEHDATSLPGAADELDLAFARALRRAVTSASGVASRPGQLRQQLVTLLGTDRTAALRARVHRAVSAAEEHLPATLVSLAPVSDATLERLATDLAARRGWTVQAAREATKDWSDALGLVPDLSVPPKVQ